MSFLMCGDTAVFQTITKQVLCPELMPCPAEHFEAWKRGRIFLQSNRIAEEESRDTPRQILARRLSLQDCYWFKANRDTAAADFRSVSPYYQDFGEYLIRRSDKSAPSYVLGGSVPKKWVRRSDGGTAIYKVMLKEWVSAETAALTLAARLGIPVPDFERVSDTEILVKNITTPAKMLMTFCGYNKFDGLDFDAAVGAYISVGFEARIAEEYTRAAILFDAVVSNYDRYNNPANWGYFKSPDTGAVSPAPLYDFNLAHRNTRNPYLHKVKNTDKALLNKWLPTVKAFGDAAWTENLEQLIINS